MSALPLVSTTPGLLCLQDGAVFEGQLLASGARAAGEVVFTTAMTGYQPLVSDPSFRGQVVCMTAPMVGNHGTDEAAMESTGPQVAGLVMRSADERWCTWLAGHGVPALTDVDTRSVALHLRRNGVMGAALGPSRERDALLAAARGAAPPPAIDLVAQVATRERTVVAPTGRASVALVDLGVRRSLLAGLVAAGAAVTTYPPDVDPATLLAHDGVVISSGPGDPAGLPSQVELVRELLGRRPLLGICLGHQLLGIALGGRTRKLPFGHRGANHPVLERASGNVLVTSQNHGYEVEPSDERSITHHSLYDGSVEGLARPDLRARSVQFHPEAGPGPHDAHAMLDAWVGEVAGAS